MDRRDFLKFGGTGLAGLALGSLTNLEGMFEAEAYAAPTPGMPWKFGVMADTQWRTNHDGQNPGTCAVGIINKLNAQFIAHGVRFVVQVGDLCDSETDDSNGNVGVKTMPVRAAAAQALYDAGIGFFPVRGNHEGSKTAAQDFPVNFPQTKTGIAAWNGGGSTLDVGATNFNSPSAVLSGLSYSFDYDNVRLVFIDQFTRPDGSGSDNNSAALDQVSWVDSRLSDPTRPQHALVFSHKNLIGQNHTDCLFGANPGSNATQRDTFIKSLYNNGVRYQLGGHDHMHQRAIINTADGTARVKQVICASDSMKFYVPQTGASDNDRKYDSPSRETVLDEECYTIGYYIFTVDGPKVTVDFYSSTTGNDYGFDAGTELLDTPTNTAFYKRESWGYSLNGREFLVNQGAAYTAVSDSFNGTTARILNGKNNCTAIDASGAGAVAARKMVKAVNTGWTARQAADVNLASHACSIWGIQDNLQLWDQSLTGLLPATARTDQGDTYCLSMTYDRTKVKPAEVGKNRFGIAVKDTSGVWVNAVDRNHGGTKKFVVGPYSTKHKLGTYGYDPKTKTCWAVLNHEGQFAVARNI